MDYNFLHNPFYLIQREVCFASIVCLGFSFHGCAREIAVESFPGYETLCEKTHRCTDRCGVLRTSNETISTRCSQISIHIRERETETEREREKPYRNILIIFQRDSTQSSLFIILQVHSTCFGCQTHPSSGVHKTVNTASGTGHILCSYCPPTWPS